MRAVFGILSLVIVLAVIGVVAKKQLQVVAATPVAPAGTATPAASAGIATPAAPAPTVPQQARALEDQLRSETQRALQQGAQRTDAAER